MKTKDKRLIKLLGTMEILDSEEITYNNPRTEDDVTYTISNTSGSETVTYRILADSVDDETVDLLLKAEQLKALKSIRKMIMFFTVLTVVMLALFVINIFVIRSLLIW